VKYKKKLKHKQDVQWTYPVSLTCHSTLRKLYTESNFN